MSTDNALTPAQPVTNTAVIGPANLVSNPLAFLTDTGAFEHLWRLATGYSRSKLVPVNFQNNRDDCFIICQLALRLRVDPYMLMQCTYVVHGRPGIEAKMGIALLNASGKIKGTLKSRFDGDGDNYGCTAWCIDAETGDRVTGPKVTWKMVKAERWNAKDGSKWNTMPDLMFVYRAAMFLIRTNYPEVLMGMQTTEELEDIQRGNVQTELANQDRLELLLGGEPDAKPPETPPTETTDAKSEPAPDETERRRQEGQAAYARNQASTAAPESPAPDTDAEPVPTVPPAVNAGELFNEYCDLLSQAEGITEVHQLASRYRQAIGPIPEWTQKINDRAEMRISEIRGSRGGAANQKRMV